MPDSLEFYFELVARDTVCEGARLELEVVPARLRCGAAAREWELDDAAVPLPARAAAGDVAVVAGEEFEVESIDVEEEEQCIA